MSAGRAKTIRSTIGFVYCLRDFLRKESELAAAQKQAESERALRDQLQVRANCALSGSLTVCKFRFARRVCVWRACRFLRFCFRPCCCAACFAIIS